MLTGAWPAAVVRSAAQLLVALQRSLVAYTDCAPGDAAPLTHFARTAVLACEGLLRDALTAAVGSGQPGTMTQVIPSLLHWPTISPVLTGHRCLWHGSQ